MAVPVSDPLPQQSIQAAYIAPVVVALFIANEQGRGDCFKITQTLPCRGHPHQAVLPKAAQVADRVSPAAQSSHVRCPTSSMMSPASLIRCVTPGSIPHFMPSSVCHKQQVKGWGWIQAACFRHPCALPKAKPARETEVPRVSVRQIYRDGICGASRDTKTCGNPHVSIRQVYRDGICGARRDTKTQGIIMKNKEKRKR